MSDSGPFSCHTQSHLIPLQIACERQWLFFSASSLTYIISWPPASKWPCPIFAQHSHYTLSYDKQHVSDSDLSSRQFDHISPHGQQQVCDSGLFICWYGSYRISWLSGSEWQCHYFCQKSHLISFYNKQYVSDGTFLLSTRSYPITNRKWATMWFLSARDSHHIPWPIASEWHCAFFLQRSPITFYQQQVSNTALFPFYSLNVSHSYAWYPLANREWVIVPYILQDSLIPSHPMANSLWVTMPFLLPRHWNHISSHDQ